MGTPVEEKKREGKIGAEGGRGLYVGKVGGPGSPSSDTRQMRTEGVALGSQLPAVVARQRTWPEEAMVAAEMKGEAVRRQRMQTRWPPRSSRGPAEDERERSRGGGWCRLRMRERERQGRRMVPAVCQRRWRRRAGPGGSAMPAEVATEEDDRDSAFFYSWPRSIGWDYGSSDGIRLGRWPLVS